MANNPLVFVGSALSDNLGPAVTRALSTSLGSEITPAEATIGFFRNGVPRAEFAHSVRGRDAFVLASECAAVVDEVPRTASDHFRQMVFMVRNLKLGSARRVVVVMPYLEMRQDRRIGARSRRAPVTVRDSADQIVAAGADEFITVEPHSDVALSCSFPIPHTGLNALALLVNPIVEEVGTDPMIVVAPDKGGVERALGLVRRIERTHTGREFDDIPMIHKGRPGEQTAEVKDVYGAAHIQGRVVAIPDDIVDTFGTAAAGIKAVLDRKATRVIFAAVHPVFSGAAVANIAAASITRMIVTDTIPLSPVAAANPKIRVVSTADLIASAMARIVREDSVSALNEH